MGTIEPNAGQESMRLKFQICERIMDFIYEKQNKILDDNIIDLALENQILLNVITPTFIFQDDFYPKSLFHAPMVQPFNKILDPSLYDKMDKLVNANNWEQKIEQVQIKHCISQFVMESNVIADLYNLFPEQIMSYLDKKYLMEDSDNAPDPLSSEKIDKIKKQNSQALLALNKLFIARLLLNNI